MCTVVCPFSVSSDGNGGDEWAPPSPCELPECVGSLLYQDEEACAEAIVAYCEQQVEEGGVDEERCWELGFEPVNGTSSTRTETVTASRSPSHSITLSPSPSPSPSATASAELVCPLERPPDCVQTNEYDAGFGACETYDASGEHCWCLVFVALVSCLFFFCLFLLLIWFMPTVRLHLHPIPPRQLESHKISFIGCLPECFPFERTEGPNRDFCDQDEDLVTGILANDACPQCGKCMNVSAPDCIPE